MNAATYGRVDIAEFLLELGSKINETSKNGENALLRACYYNRIEMVKLLVKKGAGLEARDMLGSTPLMVAIFRKNPQIMDYLLQEGAEIDFSGENQALISTIKGNLENIETLKSVLAKHKRLRRLMPVLKALETKGDSEHWNKELNSVNKNIMHNVLA